MFGLHRLWTAAKRGLKDADILWVGEKQLQENETEYGKVNDCKSYVDTKRKAQNRADFLITANHSADWLIQEEMNQTYNASIKLNSDK